MPTAAAWEAFDEVLAAGGMGGTSRAAELRRNRTLELLALHHMSYDKLPLAQLPAGAESQSESQSVVTSLLGNSSAGNPQRVSAQGRARVGLSRPGSCATPAAAIRWGCKVQRRQASAPLLLPQIRMAYRPSADDAAPTFAVASEGQSASGKVVSYYQTCSGVSVYQIDAVLVPCNLAELQLARIAADEAPGAPILRLQSPHRRRHRRAPAPPHGPGPILLSLLLAAAALLGLFYVSSDTASSTTQG